MVKRKRSNQVVFRVNDEELEELHKKIAQSNLTQQEYLIKSALDKDIVVIPREEYAEILVELSRQGNNLNQIARKLNTSDQDQVDEIAEMSKELTEIWQQLKSLIQKQV